MCIVAVAWQLFDDMPLVLLSNRDEFFDRPTTPPHQWVDAPIFAGRDDKSGGTWLGHDLSRDLKSDLDLNLTQDLFNDLAPDLKIGAIQHNESQRQAYSGRWAAVLNFRDGVQASPEQRSRGELVTHFLTSTLSPLEYARQIDLQAYAGFNLIVGDGKQAVVVNNRGYPPTPLHSGLHIFSNGQPGSSWFKSERLRGRVHQEVLPLIAEGADSATDTTDADEWQNSAWEVLSDTTAAPADQLPDTGMPIVLEQSLSAICIDTPQMPNYGTRTQSILTLQLKDAQHSDGRQPRLKLISREYEPKFAIG